MRLAPEKIISVFELTFWWEAHQDDSGNWRGYVLHERVKSAVNSPEDAFQIVRNSLAHYSRKQISAEVHLADRSEDEGLNDSPSGALPQSSPHRLLSLWRKLRGERP